MNATQLKKAAWKEWDHALRNAKIFNGKDRYERALTEVTDRIIRLQDQEKAEMGSRSSDPMTAARQRLEQAEAQVRHDLSRTNPAAYMRHAKDRLQRVIEEVVATSDESALRLLW